MPLKVYVTQLVPIFFFRNKSLNLLKKAKKSTEDSLRGDYAKILDNKQEKIKTILRIP